MTRRDLRAEILVQATPLFIAHGYRGLSMRQIAEAVGVTKAALYYCFPRPAATPRAGPPGGRGGQTPLAADQGCPATAAYRTGAALNAGPAQRHTLRLSPFPAILEP